MQRQFVAQAKLQTNTRHLQMSYSPWAVPAPPQQKDSNRLYLATLAEHFEGRAIKVKHSAKLILPDATAFNNFRSNARSGLWNVPPTNLDLTTWGCFGTWYYIFTTASRKLDKGPSLESWKMEKLQQTSSTNRCFQKSWYPQIMHFNRISTINHLFWGTPIFGNIQMRIKVEQNCFTASIICLVQETMEQQKVPLVHLWRSEPAWEKGTCVRHLGTKCRSSGFHHKP